MGRAERRSERRGALLAKKDEIADKANAVAECKPIVYLVAHEGMNDLRAEIAALNKLENSEAAQGRRPQQAREEAAPGGATGATRGRGQGMVRGRVSRRPLHALRREEGAREEESSRERGGRRRMARDGG